MTKRKKIFLWLFLCLAPILGAFLFFGYIFYGYQIEDYLQRTEFDSQVWNNRDAIEKSPYPRICMIDDLLKKQNFMGQSRQDVISLLGEPEDTDYFKDYDLVYWLGPERGFISIDSEWLVMKLNAEGKVFEYRLITD